jgi:hypothetical protein
MQELLVTLLLVSLLLKHLPDEDFSCTKQQGSVRLAFYLLHAIS